MVAIKEEEGRHFDIGRDGVVVDKLEQRKNTLPYFSVGVNKWSGHLFNGAVGPLGLTIGLAMAVEKE